MKTVREVSALTGISVRTLHHYDAIGLLKPTQVTQAGYRLYDEKALARLQTILLFRQLQFPLKEIKVILESPNFDRKKALEQQIHLLELQRRHLTGLISFAREMLETGGNSMDFSAFDKTEFTQYAAEAKARWGNTKAYQEYQQKAAQQTGAEQDAVTAQFLQIFTEIGGLQHLSPHSKEVQAMIEKLQQFITAHYYSCTLPILHGLGQMYTADPRFQATIDRAGGIGTAEFTAKAVEIYCGT